MMPIFELLISAAAAGLEAFLRPILRCFTVALLALAACPAQAQCAAGWLPGDGIPGTNGGVIAITVLPEGDVIVGGGFTTAGDIPANRIARYNPSTGAWSALGTGVSGTNTPAVRALAVLPTGDVIVGGSFTTAGDIPANQIARFNPSTGAWSALGAGVSGNNASVLALAVLSSGDMIVGGRFTTAGGVAANNIARYNLSTGAWSAMGGGVSGNVYSLAVLPLGDVIVGGQFSAAGGVSGRNNVARFNPSTGAWSALGGGVSGTVYSLAVLPLGDLIVGGMFTFPGGVAANNIARFNPSTGAWSALGTGVSGNIAFVQALAVLPTGDVIVGGIFTTAGGVSANNIARYNPSTGAWSTLGSGVTGTSSSVNDLVILPGGDVIAGGGFTTAGGTPSNNTARYKPGTGAWSALAAGPNDYVYAVAGLPAGDVIVGGQFVSTAGNPANRIARQSPSTGAWSSLGSGMNGTVYAVAVLPTGDVIAGGSFTTAGGASANNIARFNLSTGVWSALGNGVTGTSSAVYALAILPGGDLIVGGSFTTAGGVSGRNNIARYNPTTSTWSRLGVGVSGIVKALAVLPSGELIAGGSFTTAGGVLTNNIARYNLATNTWSSLGTGPDNAVYALAVTPDGGIIVGGTLSTAGGVSADFITRYNPTAGTWAALGQGTNGIVYALALLPGGDVLAAGQFTVAGGNPANRIARFNQSTGEWSALGSGLSGPSSNTAYNVYAINVLPVGDVIAGGDFTRAGGNASAYFAHYTFNFAAPSIAIQPGPQTACAYTAVTITVTPDGAGPFSYQWRKAGSPIDSNPAAGGNPSAATATLSLPHTTPADEASYDCIVANSCGSVTSNSAMLTIQICGGCSLADVAGGEPNGLGYDGIVDGSDFIALINSFAVGDPAIDLLADIAGGGPDGLSPDGIIDGSDFIAFINAFAAGC